MSVCLDSWAKTVACLRVNGNVALVIVSSLLCDGGDVAVIVVTSLIRDGGDVSLVVVTSVFRD